MPFVDDVAQFALELGELMEATITPEAELHLQVTVSGAGAEQRALIELKTATGARTVPILAGEKPCAAVLLRMGIRPDSSGRYMAVTESALGVYSTLDRTPLFRLEYRDDMRRAPSSHWQVHAERGALSHLLTIGGHERPHNLSALHLPVGGARMRPGIEDFIQFLIEELGADAVEGWRERIGSSRETWRRRQIATAVRDVPSEAVRVLTSLGYVVTAPPEGDAPVRGDTLQKW